MSRIQSQSSALSQHLPADMLLSKRSVAGLRARGDVGALAKLGFWFLLIFLFLACSRLSDLFLNPLRLPLLSSLAALTALVLTGGLFRAFSSSAGRWLIAFTAWLIVTVPFSVWPGGSVQLVIDHWSKSFLVFVIVGGLLRSVRHCRTAMYTIGCAAVATTVLSYIYGTDALAGRLALQQGVLANPNDLAQILLLGLPFLWLIGAKGATMLTRSLVGVSSVCLLLITLRTGSRAGIVGLCVLMAVMLVTFTWGRRMKLLITLAIAVVSVLPFVSTEQLARYSTILSPEVETLDDAVGSTQARLQLLRQSIDITLSNPILGTGPGMFQVASAEISARSGERGIWHEAHNTYTQVSSETGLPGFVFYLATLLTCIVTSKRLYNRTRASERLADISSSAYCLWLSLIIFAVTTFFSSVAYHMYLPMLAGLSVALDRNALAELKDDAHSGSPAA